MTLEGLETRQLELTQNHMESMGLCQGCKKPVPKGNGIYLTDPKTGHKFLVHGGTKDCEQAFYERAIKGEALTPA